MLDRNAQSGLVSTRNVERPSLQGMANVPNEGIIMTDLRPSKPEGRSPIITICGDAGTGKTSLAATFPSPIFIRVEDGVDRIHSDVPVPDVFPVVKVEDDIHEQLIWLLKEKHDYKTLVIDSVSALEAVFTEAILKQDGRAKTLSTALGGYGAGYAALATRHRSIRKMCGTLNERRGMAIVFISHADLETMRLPDTDDYSRYSLRLNAKSLPAYVDDVDLVGFVKLASALRGDDGERKKVISNGDRELICYATAASVSKNGYGITEPLDLEPGKNPLLAFMKAKRAAAKKKPPVKVEPQLQADLEADDIDPADYTANDEGN
jgi:hypothetical protein